MSGVMLEAATSAPVTQWGPRILLTLATLGVVLLGAWGMRRGWAARARRQADIPVPPQVPETLGFDPAGPGGAVGSYVATTTAGDFLDRIVVHGLGHRGRAVIRPLQAGLLIERLGEQDLWIPREAVRAVRLGSGQAQRAFESGGLILVTWQLGDRLVETGVRCDDPAEHVATAQTLTHLVPIPGGAR